jgi:hypothetical protein
VDRVEVEVEDEVESSFEALSVPFLAAQPFGVVPLTIAEAGIAWSVLAVMRFRRGKMRRNVVELGH